MIRARIIGVGSAVPKKVLSNADLEQIVETSDEWITSRTGIRERRIVSDGEKFSDLCTKAAERALKRAHVKAEDVDMILVGTISGDMPFPATACLVQNNLGASRAAASDISAACVGFLYGLHLADGLIQSQKAENVLVIGGEILSRYVDWTDRSTCVLFGDGAGAVVLQATKGDHGILGTRMKSNGALRGLHLHAGRRIEPSGQRSRVDRAAPAVHQDEGQRDLQGRREGDGRHQLGGPRPSRDSRKDDVKLFVPHQANERIIDAVGERLKFPPDRVYKNVDRYGNTSAGLDPDRARRVPAEGPGEGGRSRAADGLRRRPRLGERARAMVTGRLRPS